MSVDAKSTDLVSPNLDTTTAINIGTGEGLFSAKLGDELQFKSLKAGTNITLTPSGTEILIDASADMTTASNLGAGEGIFAAKVVEDLQFKSLVGGTNVTLSSTATEITINSVDTTSVEDGANVGAGTGLIFRDKTGLDLNFKSLIGGTNVTITNNADDITIDATDTGEANTASSAGGTESLVLAKIGVDLPFKGLTAGTNITLTPSGTDITISSIDTGEVNTASNLGAGAGVFAQKNLLDLEFKSLTAGTDITLTPSATEIEIAFTGAVGEVNLGANVGVGAGTIFRDKTGVTLNFKTLVAGTNIALVNGADDITINATDTGEVNTASNVGTGVGVFKQKTVADLEFKSLLANAEVLIASNVDDLAFSIGAIAISKITGLQTALDTKFDTIVNVGAGTGLIFRDKVAQTANLKSLIGGAGITITDNADDISIVNDNPTPAVISPSFILHNNDTTIISAGNRFLSLAGRIDDTGTEVNAQNVFPNACTLQRMTVEISSQRDGISNVTLRVNGVSVNQTIAIPASTTGTFQDLVNTDVIANGDLVNYLIVRGGAAGSLTFVSEGVEVTA